MARSLALLRGINVGGKNRLGMADLVDIFETIGCTRVETYIQSGNVVFEPPGGGLETVAPRVTAALNSRHGLTVPVITRTGDELRLLAGSSPLGDVDPRAVHVCFLADQADPSRLDPRRSPGDSFVVLGREIYLHLPNGVARTKLTNAYFDRVLGTVSTVRNWATVGALAGMVPPAG
mgnify:CR=1 FL=1